MRYQTFAILTSSLLLAACNGGGGDSNNAQPRPQPTNPITQSDTSDPSTPAVPAEVPSVVKEKFYPYLDGKHGVLIPEGLGVVLSSVDKLSLSDTIQDPSTVFFLPAYAGTFKVTGIQDNYNSDCSRLSVANNFIAYNERKIKTTKKEIVEIDKSLQDLNPESDKEAYLALINKKADLETVIQASEETIEKRKKEVILVSAKQTYVSAEFQSNFDKAAGELQAANSNLLKKILKVEIASMKLSFDSDTSNSVFYGIYLPTAQKCELKSKGKLDFKLESTVKIVKDSTETAGLLEESEAVFGQNATLECESMPCALLD